MSNLHSKITTIIFAAVSAAMLSACGGGGGGSPSTELVDNAVSARSVSNMVANLPSAEEITASDVTAVNQAIAAYNNLGNAQQFVSADSVTKLNALINAIETAKNLASSVTAAIAKLPVEVSITDAQKVSAARSSYDSLSDAQKTWVENTLVKALANAENTVATNQKLATQVETEITALPVEISKTDASKVTTARSNFTALTDVQETWVADASVKVLTRAEGVIETNRLKATDITAKINVLPVNGLDVDTEKEITEFLAIKKAYDDLSDSEETWVDLEVAKKLKDIAAKTVIDLPETSLAAINEPAPLPSAFLTLAINKQAQQFNPQMQLKKNGDLLGNQPRLIKELSVDGKTSDQDAIGVTGIGVQDLTNLENPVGKIERISKISSGQIQTNGEGNKNDVSMDALHIQDTNKAYLDSKWSSIYAIRTTTGVNIILRDPAEMGWNYQTFAYYQDDSNNIKHAYQSVGTETAANAMPSSGTATYKGVTAGHYVVNNKTQQLTADVAAVVDFSKKLVRFSTSSSQLHEAVSGVRQTISNTSLDVKGSASWSSGNQFVGTASTSNGLNGDLNGKFYGVNAAEIGGTYGLKNSDNSAQLIGGYGAKRQ